MKYLFHGNEQFISLLSLYKKINDLKDEFPDYTNEVINCENIDLNLLTEKVNTHDMFSKGRILVLKRIYLNKNKESFFTEVLFKNTNISDDILIFWEDQNIPSNTKYSKFFNNKNNFLYNDLKKIGFMKWAKEICIEKNINLNSDGIKILANRSNYIPEKFYNEIEKLNLLDLKYIDNKTLIDNISDTLEYTIWNLIDSINISDKPNTIKILENLFKTNTDPIYILIMLMRNYRQIILVKLLSETGKTNKEIVSQLKIPPFTLPSIKNISYKIDLNKFALIYEKINNLDYEIKVGNIEPKLGITLLLSFIN